LHIFHDIGRCSFYSRRRQSEFDPTEIRHGHDASEKMASYLAVGPVTNGACPHEVIVLAQTKAILRLPTIKAYFPIPRTFFSAPTAIPPYGRIDQ
jgi:hypothetical protein